MKNEIECRLCLSKKTNLFYKLDLINTSISNLNKIYLTECNDCGFCFNSGLSQEDCNIFYTSSKNYTHQLYNNDIILLHDRYNHLKSLLDLYNVKFDDEIIDLTGSDGSLIKFLIYLGYTNLSFCDLSNENMDKIKNECSSININTYKLNILHTNDFLNINKKYKFIFFNHTLEHIADFKNTLNNIKLLMNNDSYLYIEVPDNDRISFDKYNPYIEITYEHVNFFTKNTLNFLMNLHNYNCIKNDILDFKYRKNILVKAFYTLCTLNNDNIINNTNNSENNKKTRFELLDYIHKSDNISTKIYNLIDKNKKYNVFGIGLFSVYFFTKYNNFKINKFYDESRYGETILNNKIDKLENLNYDDNYIILSPLHYKLLESKLIKNNINNNNILNYIDKL